METTFKTRIKSQEFREHSLGEGGAVLLLTRQIGIILSCPNKENDQKKANRDI